MKKIAVVTGANQGLGLALVKGLAASLNPQDIVYLTARNTEKGEQALREVQAGNAQVRFQRLDITDTRMVTDFAKTMSDRHGGVDYVISNAAARIVKGKPQSQQVREFIDTNNHGSKQLLEQMVPMLNAGARYLIVASSFGRLNHLVPQLHALFDTDRLSLDDIEQTMDDYVRLMEAGEAVDEGWPEWINIPSKIGQVASARIASRLLTQQRPEDNISINAVCPGLIDTDASRPWFDDMSQAQSPDQAAEAILDLLLQPERFGSPNGELVQFGKILPWRD